MSSKQFHQESARGLPAPVYLLTAPDSFILYEAMAAVRDLYQAAESFNMDIFDLRADEPSSLEEILNALNTLPFMQERRVVIIRNIQKLGKKEAKKLEGYLTSPSETTLLVMLFEGAAPKIFDAGVLKTIKVISLAVPEREIPAWVSERARAKGIELTPRAVECLINSVGPDLGMLSSEIDKISTATEKGRVDLDDIRDTIYAGAEFSAFDLIEALRKGDSREVFRIFERLSKSVEPQMLLGALNWHYSMMKTRQVETFRLLHEADAAIKRSYSFAIEDLLVKLLKK
ncbi:MAG: DNA polymerase III subunit delta [Nitrospirales bacterium]|nr:DNA polymerase III subunit delta [Nitrospirales bacterium]